MSAFRHGQDRVFLHVASCLASMSDAELVAKTHRLALEFCLAIAYTGFSSRSHLELNMGMPNGVTVHKWPHASTPTPESVTAEMSRFGFKVYDLQTVEPWFHRDRHSHDEEEIRAAVAGVITFHFDEGPVTIEGGDILIIPAGVAHEVKTHNANTFSAFKGSRSGERHVTEYGEGKGSVEDLADRVTSTR